MTIEQTFFILKPDCISKKLEDTIINLLKHNGFEVKEKKQTKATKEKLEKHYSHIVDKPFYKDVEKYMMSGDIVIGVLEKENAIEDLRKLMGNTNPLKAEKNTIRALFGEVEDNGDIKNIIHGSDSLESMNKELSIWFN